MASSIGALVQKIKNIKKRPSSTPSQHSPLPYVAPAESQPDQVSIQISPEEAATDDNAAPYDGEGSQSADEDAVQGEDDAKSDNDAADYDDHRSESADDADDFYNDRSPVHDKYNDDEEEAAVAEAIAAAAAAEAAAAEEAAKAAAAAAAIEAAVANMPLEKISPAFTRSVSAPNLRHRPLGGGDPEDPNSTGDPRWWPSCLRALFLVLLHLGSAVLAYFFLPSHHFTRATKAINQVIDGIYFAVVTFCTVGYGDITPSSPVSRVMSTIFILIGTWLLDNPLSVLVSLGIDFAKTKARALFTRKPRKIKVR